MPASYAPRRPAGLSNSTPQAEVVNASESEADQEDSNLSLVAFTPRQPELLSATQLATRAGLQPNSRLMARLQSSNATISTSAWLDYQPPVQRPTGPVRRRGRPQRVPEIAADPLPTHHLKHEDSTDEASYPHKERRTTRAHVPRTVFMPEIFQPKPSGGRRSNLQFDANGQPLPKRKPGRPRIYPLPEDRQDGARTSSLLSFRSTGRGRSVGSLQSSSSVLGKRRAPTALNDTESNTNSKRRRKATLIDLSENEEGERDNGPKKKRRATLAFPLTEANDNEADNSEDELALPSKPKLKVTLKFQRRQTLNLPSSGPTNANLAHQTAAASVPTPVSTAHPSPASLDC